MAVVYTVGRFQPPTIGHKKLIEGVVDAAREKGGKAYVFVSAAEDPDLNPLSPAQKIPILKHMFPEGVEFVDTKTCLPGKTPCGGPRNALAWLKKLDPLPSEIYLAIGNDRKHEFEGDKLWGDGGKPFVIPIGEDRDPNDKSLNPDNMSGTKARKLAAPDDRDNDDVVAGKKDAFYAAVGYPGEKNVPEVETIYNRIREWFPRHLKRKPMFGPERAEETRAYKAQQAQQAQQKGGNPEEPYPSAFAADAELKEGGRRRRTYRRCRKCGLPKKPETQ